MKKTWDWKDLKFKGLQFKYSLYGDSETLEYMFPFHFEFGWEHQQNGVALCLGFCYLWWGYK